MKFKNDGLPLWVMFFGLMVVTLGCSEEEVFFEQFQETEVATGPSVEATDCTVCSVIAGDYSAFSAALRDSKLQSDYLSAEEKNPEGFCDTEFFTTCESHMVLIGPSTKDDRTELRQEQDLKLDEYSAMKFEAVFEDVPTSSSTKGVTIAQIHNDYGGVGRPLLRVDIVGGNKVQSHINYSYIKGDGSASNDDLVPFSDGDRLYVRLEIRGYDDKVYVYLENKTKGVVASKTYVVDSEWDNADGQYYYKTGVYTQVAGKNTKAGYRYLNFFYE